MSKKSTQRLSAPEGTTHFEVINKDRFSRRLFEALSAANMSQSELAKQIWGTREDKRGYKVARNRDLISKYLRGGAYPDARNLRKLATALKVPPESLAPELTEEAIAEETPEVKMTAIAGHDDKVHLVVNKLVSFGVAAQVISLLHSGGSESTHGQKEPSKDVKTK